MNEVTDSAALVGRILLALIFVLSGFGKIMAFTQTEIMMAAQRIPATEILLILTIVIELGGGLLIVAGLQARWAALVIFLYMIPVTYIFHVQGYLQAAAHHQAMMVMMQKINILKNVSIEGGLLLLVAFGSGLYSVDSAL